MLNILRNFISPYEHKPIPSLRDDKTDYLAADDTDNSKILEVCFAVQSDIYNFDVDVPESSNSCEYITQSISITPDEGVNAFEVVKTSKFVLRLATKGLTFNS